MNVINSGDTFACMISYCFIHSVSGLPGNDCILFKLFLLVPVCYLSISDCLYRYMFICLLIYPAVFIYLHVYISTCQSVFPSVSWCFHFLYPLILSLFQLVRFKFSFFFSVCHTRRFSLTPATDVEGQNSYRGKKSRKSLLSTNTHSWFDLDFPHRVIRLPSPSHAFTRFNI